ncbi:restriction endonuclease subunit S [Photobacterium chitinilyticum]|uniref:restriction endonuclease subunit S n=1 Tax=Photobacterium chitinilyticum TaxID=2485123 RepID=UPI003D11783A
MNEYKDSKKDSWALVELGDIAFSPEKTKPADKPTKKIKYLDISGIDNEKNIVVSYKEYLGKDAPSRAQQSIKAGDVAFSTVRPYLKNIALVPDYLDGAVGSTGFCFLRPYGGVESKYIFYWVISQSFINEISKYQKGSSYPAVTNKDVFSQNIPLPATPVQRKIVEKIEELFSYIDAGVEGLKQAKVKLQQYRQSVLKDAVTGKLTEQWREQNADKLEPADTLLERILEERRANWEAEQLKAFEEKGKTPKNDKWKEKYKAPKLFGEQEQPHIIPSGWEWCYFEAIGVVSGGLTKNSKRNSFDNKLPYLRVANVYANELRLEDIQEIGVTDTELDRVLLEEKDLLIVEGNGSPDQIGRLAVWDNSISPCVHQNHLIKVRLTDKALCDFIVYWLMSLPGREQIKAVASSTSGLYTLSISKISGLPIPLPSLNEAIEISNLVSDKLSSAIRTEEELTKKIKHSEQLKSSILSKAFSGHLVKNNGSDETAEQLLGNIRSAKQQLEQKAKLAKKKPTARAKKMKRRPIIDVLRESKKELNVDELFELSGFQGDVTPEGVEAFYQELKAVAETKGVKVTPIEIKGKKQGDTFEYKEVKENEAG